MHIDNDFSIKQFLLSNGFEQTRDSDKRDNFKKTYFDPWTQKDKEILVTLYYDYGSNCYTIYSGHVMQVYTKVDHPSTTSNYVNIYDGIWPQNFDFALSLFRHILPGEQEFQDIETTFLTLTKNPHNSARASFFFDHIASGLQAQTNGGSLKISLAILVLL